jgi:sigma-B regulation protein RsbU (phosphoserine phosphatase)
MQTLPTDRRVTPHQLPLPLAGEGGPKGRVRGVDLHAISNPAKSFTGDFYFTHRRGERLWLAIGDVAGKGLPAAVVMAMIQEELEHRITSCAETLCDPATTVQRLDAYLKPLLSRNRFATAAVGYLHDNGTLLIANAGHSQPLIARRDGTIQAIDSTGPVLGLLPASSWRSVSIKLQRGDTVLLYTDGATEAGRDEFGIERLKHTLAEAALQSGATSRSVATAVAHAVRSHASPTDDLTLLVARL